MSTSMCYIGYLTNDNDCHSTVFTNKTNLFNLEDFTSDDLLLLEYRVPNFKKESKGSICGHHKCKFLNYYESMQRKCCEPLQKHGAKSGNLRKVSLQMSNDFQKISNVIIIPGQKLCPTYYEEVRKQIKSLTEETEATRMIEVISDEVSERKTRSNIARTVESEVFASVSNIELSEESDTPKSNSTPGSVYLTESQEIENKCKGLKRILDVFDLPLPKRQKISEDQLKKKLLQ